MRRQGKNRLYKMIMALLLILTLTGCKAVKEENQEG